MKTPVVRKPNSNVIVDPYKELDKSNTKLLQIMKFPPETEADKNWMMYGDGSFHSGGSRHIFIYLLPASVAAFYIEIDKKESNFINQGLTDEQKQNNRTKSQTRCLVEHIFGFVEGAMNGSFVRSIGMMRAKAANALTNLVYNIFRYVQINIYHPQFITCKG